MAHSAHPILSPPTATGPPSIFRSHIRLSLWSLHGRRRSLEPPPPTALERKREGVGERGKKEGMKGGGRNVRARNSKWNTNTHSVPQIEGICLEKKKTTATGARTAPFPYSHSPVASSRKIVFKEGNQMERGGGTAGYQVTPPQWRFFRAPFPASNAQSSH